ncbi:C39 family peptidase [Massilia sp. PAMC28688]|uniref:C39 family peptidase n=1 Tax=Massilia sp. PAMC28688 TaxID=2861283 RepID=UPI001C6355E0|nr:C39 family peptidase [Massilia sp. PAMC28688]
MRNPLLLGALLVAASPPAMPLELAVGGARFQLPVGSVQAARFGHTLRQQYDFSCGSAALATLLSYHYGYPISEQEVFAHMYQQGDRASIGKAGFSLLDMQRFLAARGFKADGFQLPLARLEQARLPALALVAEKGYRHFVVIKGIAGNRVLLGDPSRGTRALSVADFTRIWIGSLLFVIHGPGSERVRFNDAADWRAAPAAPVAATVPRDMLHNTTLPRHGPGDF